MRTPQASTATFRHGSFSQKENHAALFSPTATFQRVLPIRDRTQHNMAEQPVAEVLNFPTDPSQFDQDHRISFSRLDNKYIAVQESDGTEFEFDAQLKRWIPSADEDEEALIRMQQSAYGAPEPTRDARTGNGKRRREDDLEVSCARWSISEPSHNNSSA